jgi:hypothetical protein
MIYQISNENIDRFVNGGHAIFTILNPKTGGRFTYKVVRPKGAKEDSRFRFVSVLTGPDNNCNYSFIGIIFDDDQFRHSRKSRVKKNSLSFRAFDWFWRHRENPAPAEIYHEGCCGRCGRRLTTPESIETGLGPICAER